VRPQMLWPIWPGCALLVALLVLSPKKVWPILITAGFIGFMLNDLLIFGLSTRFSLTLILADTVEVLIAALGIGYFLGGVVRLDSINDFARYFLVAVILAPTAAAFVTASAFRGEYWVYWRISTLTEGLALLTVTPAIIGLANIVIARRYESPGRYLETVAIMAGLFVFGHLAFISSDLGHPELLYSLVPFLLWSALRLGVMGTSIAMNILAFLSVWGVVHGHGPFTGRGPINDVVSLQLFLLFAATSFLFLAALVEEDRQSKTALQKSEEKFRSVFRDAGIGMVVVSLDGRFLAANGTFCDYLGYTEQELLTRTVQSVTFPDDWPVFSRKLKAVLTAGPGLHRFGKRCLHRTGRIVYTETSTSLIRNRNGDPDYFVGEVLDVTKRKEAEEVLSSVSRKLIEAQEQERARIARELHDDIAQRMALLAIGFDTLQQDLPPQSPDILSRIHVLRKQIVDITTDVQTISHSLHSTRVETLGLVAAVRSICKEFGIHQRIEVAFEGRDLPTPSSPDVSLCLIRVLQEALQNAAKHSGARHIDVLLEGAPNEISLTVIDKGIGFNFKAAIQGRGLGLTSMQERVRLVNGTIVIQSRPMGGTTIHVRVPLTSERAPQKAAG
jgi:PAS domain S-box-containing protein